MTSDRRRRLRRRRNVVLNHNLDRVRRQRYHVAVKVGRRERTRQVKRQSLKVAATRIKRQMIGLVLQIKQEVAAARRAQPEHLAVGPEVKLPNRAAQIDKANNVRAGAV